MIIIPYMEVAWLLKYKLYNAEKIRINSEDWNIEYKAIGNAILYIFLYLLKRSSIND